MADNNFSGPVNEHVLLVYFEYFVNTLKRAASSLWPLYSKLKDQLIKMDGVDISNYHLLRKFIKENTKGYEPKKANTLSAAEIDQFLNTAPDAKYLTDKVKYKFLRMVRTTSTEKSPK